jgi:hypothetical protein
MMIYDKVSIQILAEEELINGPDELGLSDRCYEFQIKLEEWLANEMGTEFPELDFAVE